MLNQENVIEKNNKGHRVISVVVEKSPSGKTKQNKQKQITTRGHAASIRCKEMIKQRFFRSRENLTRVFCFVT